LLDKEKRPYSILVVENSLALLETLSEASGDVCLTDLTKSLGMNKSSVWRLLSTFTQKGYLEREENSTKYRLGMAAYVMGVKFRSRMSLLNKAKPLMSELAKACNEAVYLAAPCDDNFYLIDMVDTSHAVRTRSLVGNAYPLAETSIGQVVLACREDIQSGSKPLGSPVSGDWQAWLHDKTCYDFGGFGEGTASIAVPLFNVQRKLCGVLSIIGPDFRLPLERIKGELFSRLQEASRVISYQA